MDQESHPPHVLMLPLPFQGPVNSMLKLAELICLSGLHITFLVTDYIHGRLLRYSDVQSLFDRYPGFRLAAISDGLPDHHPRPGAKFLEIFESMNTTTKRLLREMLASGRLSEEPGRGPVACVIADGGLAYGFDVADEIGIPIFSVRTISACCLWVFFCLPKLIESGELPFQGENLDVPIKSVAGTEAFLQRRDLPSFCRGAKLDDPYVQFCKKEGQVYARAYGLILNTFEDLEGPMLSQIRTICPNLYTIGPLHAHLKTRLAAKVNSSPASSNSLWEVDRSCMSWLDSQPVKSVLYVSFGSIAAVTMDQLMEFWHGLVNSGKKFLWVIRPDSVADIEWEGQIPTEVAEGTKERGYIVGWAPQEEVLAHPSVGGFLTHSGWNSTLESVYEGVPMICWPYFLDQQVNSRFVGEVWKLGLDMKDTCDRVIVEKTVKGLMEERRDEFQRSANEMGNLAKRCLNEGGSSYGNLSRLITDIRLISSRAEKGA